MNQFLKIIIVLGVIFSKPAQAIDYQRMQQCAQLSCACALVAVGVLAAPTIYKLVKLLHYQGTRDRERHALIARTEQERVELAYLPQICQRVASASSASYQRPHGNEENGLFSDMHDALMPFLQTNDVIKQKRDSTVSFLKAHAVITQKRRNAITAAYQAKNSSL